MSAEALEAIKASVGKDEVTMEKLAKVLFSVGIQDREKRVLVLEDLWRRGFLFCCNPVRGLWKVTRP